MYTLPLGAMCSVMFWNDDKNEGMEELHLINLPKDHMHCKHKMCIREFTHKGSESLVHIFQSYSRHISNITACEEHIPFQGTVTFFQNYIELMTSLKKNVHLYQNSNFSSIFELLTVHPHLINIIIVTIIIISINVISLLHHLLLFLITKT